MNQPETIPPLIKKERSPLKNAKIEEKREEIGIESPQNINNSKNQMISEKTNLIKKLTKNFKQTQEEKENPNSNTNTNSYSDGTKIKIVKKPPNSSIFDISSPKKGICSSLNEAISRFENNSKIQAIQNQLNPFQNHRFKISSPIYFSPLRTKSDKIKIVKIPHSLQEKLDKQ